MLGSCQTAEKETLEGSDKENLDPREVDDGQKNVDPPAKASISSSPTLASVPITDRGNDDASKGMCGLPGSLVFWSVHQR